MAHDILKNAPIRVPCNRMAQVVECLSRFVKTFEGETIHLYNDDLAELRSLWLRNPLDKTPLSCGGKLLTKGGPRK